MIGIDCSTGSTAPADVERAIDRLRLLHDGEAGVIEVVSCGPAAIPALRRLLFQREPSGIFAVRCRAVEVLARLGAHAVLIEFLSAPRDIADPVERLGEDAVVNAAALALPIQSNPRVFPLLLELARRPCLTGVISALGRFGRPEAIPALVEALADDASRQAAAAGLKAVGRAARHALMQAASERLPSADRESISSLRRRRSALRALAEIGLSKRLWPSLRGLTDDADAEVAIGACTLGLKYDSAGKRTFFLRRLIGLLSQVDWPLRGEIENALHAEYEGARDVIAEELATANPGIDGAVRRILVRVQMRGEHRS